MLKTQFFLAASFLFFSFGSLKTQTTRHMVYSADTTVLSLVKTYDNKFVLLSAYYYKKTALILKTDSLGGILWQKKIINQSAYYPIEMVETVDHGIAYLMRDSLGLVLTKLDSAGNLKWQKGYQYQGLSATSIAPNDIGGVVISGGGCIGQNFLIYTDQVGNIIWSKSFQDSNSLLSASTDVIQVSDSAIIVVGLLCDSNAYNKMFLMSVTKIGSVNWFKEYFHSTHKINGFKVVKSMEGGYTIMGVISTYPQFDVFMVHTDTLGIPIWEKTLQFSSDFEFQDLIQLADSSYIMAGISVPAQDYKGLLCRMDVNGNLLWAKSEGDAAKMSNDGFRRLAWYNDDRYAAVGSHGMAAFWMMDDNKGLCMENDESVSLRLDTIQMINGNPVSYDFNLPTVTLTPVVQTVNLTETIFCPLFTDVRSGSFEDFEIFPNPTSGNLFVTVSSNRDVNYTLVTLDGVQMDEGKLNAGRNELNVNFLTSGLYILKLENAVYRLVIAK